MTNPNTASVSETNITLGSKNQKGDRHGLRFHKLAHAGVSIHEPCDLEGQRCARRLTLSFATERSHQRDAETMQRLMRDATSDTVGTGSLGRILSAIVSTMGVALVGYGTFALLFGW